MVYSVETRDVGLFQSSDCRCRSSSYTTKVLPAGSAPTTDGSDQANVDQGCRLRDIVEGTP